MKEDLPIAASALHLSIHPWEIGSCERFREGFCRTKQTATEWTICFWGPLANNNQKRIAGFALKSRLPTMYGNRERVEASGLMSYGRTSRTATGASHITWTES